VAWAGLDLVTVIGLAGLGSMFSAGFLILVS
jgi:hypothetical protein